MENRLSVIEHKGKKILLTDLSNLRETAILNIIEETIPILVREKIRLQILIINNTSTTKTIKEKSIEAIKKVEAEGGKLYNALIGLRLSQKIIASIIKNDSYFASNIEDAKEWLIKKI